MAVFSVRPRTTYKQKHSCHLKRVELWLSPSLHGIMDRQSTMPYFTNKVNIRTHEFKKKKKKKNLLGNMYISLDSYYLTSNSQS
jgi:hypothetical protein